MSAIFAPTYVILTMGYFEVHLNDICEVKWGSELEEFFIENWSIILGDYKLFDTINSNNEAIQFTM